MTAKVLLLILLSVGLSAAAQVVLKLGMGGDSARHALADASLWRGYLGLLSTPAIVIGLAAYGLGALIWLRVLAHLDISQAYPFVAMGIVLTMLAGALTFGEVVSPLRVFGAVLVVAGVLLIGMS